MEIASSCGTFNGWRGGARAPCHPRERSPRPHLDFSFERDLVPVSFKPRHGVVPLRISVSNVYLGSYAELFKDRKGFQRWFSERLYAEPGMRRRVLDIGCGPSFPAPLTALSGLPAQLDGVDPGADISQRTDLTLRWSADFEDAAMPEGEYDLAFAYNVVEHVSAAKPFFAKLAGVLKPGGVFWAITPHAWHPFPRCVRAIQALRLKEAYAHNRTGVNDYPAYYRLNSTSQVLQAIDGREFAKAEFFRLPCMQWDRYFPAPVRFIPHVYDRLLGLHCGPAMLLFGMRLTKAA